jgi:glycosyltransferase involved in cell wall biosynthesis
MIRVAALTGSRNDPSSRFRVRQFLAPLRRLGIEAVECRPWLSKYAPGVLQLSGIGLASRVVHAWEARRFDIAWLNRELVTGHETIERLVGKRRLFDVDDAIWGHGRSNFARRIAAKCAGVIAGNERIAEYFRGWTPRVWTVPTTVDTDTWSPASRIADGETNSFIIGWSGTRWNLPYLEALEAPLARFLADHRDARLLVICDRRPRFRQLSPHQVVFQRWSPGAEVAGLRQASVAIMPLAKDEWSGAKCATKMLCGMALGLPVVVAPVGVAAEILERGQLGLAARCDDDWYAALSALRSDPAARASLGQHGREVVVRDFSLASALLELGAIFHEVASS